MVSAATDAPFDYESLPIKDTIPRMRLLSFERQAHDSWPIRCNINAFLLAEAPNYAALPYMWGDAAEKVQLRCNDSGNVSITPNLNQALEYVQRHHSSPLRDFSSGIRWLWVDAVCINQDDPEERRDQVLLMRRIYQQARKTVIWPGESDPTSNTATRLVLKLRDAKIKYQEAKETRVFHAMRVEEREAYGIPTSYSSWSDFEALNTFLSSGWPIWRKAMSSS